MKGYLSVFAALAMSLMGSAFVHPLEASELDEKTVITISGPVTVEGTVLPAGQYVFKLADSWPSRSIVNIFNSDETRLITTVLAIHARIDWSQAVRVSSRSMAPVKGSLRLCTNGSIRATVTALSFCRGNERVPSSGPTFAVQLRRWG